MKALLRASVAVLAVSPAFADDWTVSPWTAEFDNLTLTAGAEADGGFFAPSLPKAAGADQRWATGSADLKFKLERNYDSGLTLGLKTSFEVLRDRLSYDNYGGNLVQKVYGVAQTGLGSVEVGMTDGAGYVMAVTGPVVDGTVSLDNPNMTFFIDPSTGRSFQEVFALSTAQNASSNYAKFSYYTPRILGLQVGVSYTPSQNREVIPFLNNGPQAENRQKSIWETAVSYSQDFEDFAVGLSGTVALAHGDGKHAEDASLTDWGIGAEIDIPIGEEMKWAFGGGYRRANTYTFDIYSARTRGATESAHLSTTLNWNDWSLGGEYGRGTADGGVGLPKFGTKAYGVSLGYQLNQNWAATLGWQNLAYDRDVGTFYNGASAISMDAVFLHLKFKV